MTADTINSQSSIFFNYKKITIFISNIFKKEERERKIIYMIFFDHHLLNKSLN